MTLFTPNYSFPFPELSDIPNEPTQVEALAEAVDTALAAEAALRATAATRAALLATLLGGATAQSKQFATTDTVNTITATGYVDLTRVTTNALCGVTFVAPPSGIVKVEWGGSYHSSIASGSTVWVGATVSTGGVLGSGTPVSAAADNEAAPLDGTNNTPATKSKFVGGLTPGSTYNAWIQWRNSGASTATATVPFLSATPVLA